MAFELICEIEPATRPDLSRVHDQVAVFGSTASSFLIPDNHIGRATVSSVAVAHEVAALGHQVITCLNSRDRNVLGFRRDLLTAATYGLRDYLFVYGDRPESGKRSDDITVRTMIEQTRDFAAEHVGSTRPVNIGVTTTLRTLPAWKREADRLFAQVTFSVDELLAWRESLDFDGQVLAGVMVVASASMGRKLSADIQQLAVPSWLIEALERDRNAGVDFAVDQVAQIRESGAFDGVHLVPVGRYRDVAARLQR
jgi:5,10-methylenetetrahydrofolate reductase